MTHLWTKVEEMPNGCIEWRGGKSSKGYGKIKYRGVRWYVHRLVYFLTFGPIPEGVQVCHHCDNTLCINPKHLFLGTNQDNVDDKIRKNRMPRGESHYRNKFSLETLKKIQEDPRTQSEIAKDYHTSQSHISRIKRKVYNSPLDEV